MAERALLDTGFLVALANRKDRDHQRCVAAARALRYELVTVQGVLVEACFLASREHDGPSRVIELALRLGARMHSSSPSTLLRAAQLMRTYSRMDLVDALLVSAAEELSVPRILTLDRRDFSVYRLKDGSALELLPD